ncbi:hypothetical protein AVEN_91784-1 [Araneus ventricosus]|uniref:Uncharacterized protein n=1 Tax=Araneus ventricosus TaxID=182803 RepID=A0A4Y2IS47_ARAVE|nr:hypothetical protein AVEN_91784-1 [Araneus ventricosus]
MRKKIMPGEKATDEQLTFDKELKRCNVSVQQEIHIRCEGIPDRFAILEARNLIEISKIELPKFVQNLGENYNERSADGILT